MGEITQLLRLARAGEPERLNRVFALLYPELHRLAATRLGGRPATLTPTVLVHEAFVRLCAGTDLTLNDRHHFFACAAHAMRYIVVDHARRRSAEKRGGGESPVTLDDQLSALLPGTSPGELLELNQALDTLGRINPRQREVVEMRFFAGLEFAQIAELLACSERTAKREWVRARAFLHAQLAG